MAVWVPRTIGETTELLRDKPSATLLAGGTDLMVGVNSGMPVDQVIALDRVDALREWRVHADGTRLWIGAGVPYRELVEGEVSRLVPALSEASRTVGSPQIRAVGTIGGNLGTCSPAGDTLPVLAALDAVVHLESVDGSRELSFAEFMVGVKRTARRAGELITGVTVPVVNGWQGYSKVGVRNAMVIATASSCLVWDSEQRSVRVALGSVGPVIIRCSEAEQWFAQFAGGADARPADSVIDEFAERCARLARPIDDHRSTAAYRRHAVQVLVGRQLRRALSNG